MSCLVEIPTGNNTFGLPSSLGSLGKSSVSSLEVCAVCLGRSTGCPRSTIFPVSTCLGGRSADHLGISAHCLRANCLGGRGTGCLRSAIFPGTNCLAEITAWEITVCGEEVLAAWAALSSWELTAWEIGVLTAWGSALSTWEELELIAWELTVWGVEALAAWEVLSSWELTAWGELTAWQLTAWELTVWGGRVTGCLRSAFFPKTTCLGDRGASHLGASTPCLGIDFRNSTKPSYISLLFKQ